MSTSNFNNRPNASAIYAFIPNEDEDREMAYEFFEEDLRSLLDERDFEHHDLPEVGSKELTMAVANVEIIVRMLIKAEPGYYEGMQLDYEFFYEVGQEQDEMPTDDEIIEDLTCYYDIPKEDAKKQVGNIKRAIEKMKAELTREGEEILTSATNHKLSCIGTASNGESFYKKL